MMESFVQALVPNFSVKEASTGHDASYPVLLAVDLNRNWAWRLAKAFFFHAAWLCTKKSSAVFSVSSILDVHRLNKQLQPQVLGFLPFWLRSGNIYCFTKHLRWRRVPAPAMLGGSEDYGKHKPTKSRPAFDDDTGSDRTGSVVIRISIFRQNGTTVHMFWHAFVAGRLLLLSNDGLHRIPGASVLSFGWPNNDFWPPPCQLEFSSHSCEQAMHPKDSITVLLSMEYAKQVLHEFHTQKTTLTLYRRVHGDPGGAGGSAGGRVGQWWSSPVRAAGHGTGRLAGGLCDRTF
jgi:hypothetical protein